MNTLVIVAVTFSMLVVGYVLYGGYLCRQWGIDDDIRRDEGTPAHTMADGVDYVAAPSPVLMGHHFSSIAGAGPITGPVQAAMFGWLPVTLWIVIGGIFFGGVHDLGSIYASLKHKGQSIGEIIAENMSLRAKRLFIIFAYLTLILVIAAFTSIVASTFCATFDADGAVDLAKSESNSSVAMVSLLFIVIAIAFGVLVNRMGMSLLTASGFGVCMIVLIIAIGINWHPLYLSATTWMFIIGAYIAVASVVPVWILLQPRDYLSSFLLFTMLAVAIVGVIGGRPDIDLAYFPTITGFAVETSHGTQYLFPILFTTVACGAISGSHSLVSSGTTSKQLDKLSDAKPIAYGGMLIECALAIVTVCAIAYFRTMTKGAAGSWSPAQIFAGGVAGMIALIPGCAEMERILFTLLVLTYSAFCLTSLDTAARIARSMFQEFWLDHGETPASVTDGRKILVDPYFATIVTVVLGVALGMNGYGKIWSLFGAANQLLAGLGLLAVATWLGNIGRNNKMFLIPMGFMMLATITSLCLTISDQFDIIMGGTTDWGPYAQTFFGVLLVILSIVLVIEGVRSLTTKTAARNC